ncbi:hypothetical protein BDV38DRAFT_236862 [Aspergillus pseudotamarii]|uniref:Uncharacterized protein n=1 Tax=Aspergillus pseudotamarii TaxID=132259 RepID=A0A5N6T722_ASPPS|nr:uncharacterized protein BDV38DRAFT_236862 [Aspergillus pseudotamarii]KAE8142011.1 hypothetical protein BDV38DRAFT_236862 [Aspergillus pseudotamarii]
MLERIRDPSRAGVAPPPRDAFWDGDVFDPCFWVELVLLLLTRRRRNCSLFIFSQGFLCFGCSVGVIEGDKRLEVTVQVAWLPVGKIEKNRNVTKRGELKLGDRHLLSGHSLRGLRYVVGWENGRGDEESLSAERKSREQGQRQGSWHW